MPIAVYALTVAAFAIGTTEFVVLGLLPEVAADLHVSIPSAGWLVSGYALGVTVGAPIMAVVTSSWPRKAALLALMAIFIVGNVLCATAGGYGLLMFARVVTAFCHGAFFGIGSVVAAGLVAPERRASAVALMFTGLTLANVLGVPLGTALGQALGWRSTFWAVAVSGVLALVAIYRLLPKGESGAPANLRNELKALHGAGIWLALATTVVFSAAVFTLFTYIAPILRDVTGVSPRGVSGVLLLVGLGLTIGNIAGGKLADKKLMATLMGVFAAMAAVQLFFVWSSALPVAAAFTLFIWGITVFGAVPGLQINVVTYGRDAPNLVATLNIGAFNLGNALGAWVGGEVIDRGYRLNDVPLAAAVLALTALGLTVIAVLRNGGTRPASA